MIKKFLCLLGIAALLLPGALADEAKRVLMIGNSYTFYNYLPEALMALSQKTDCPLEVESYTVGAMSLRGFLESPEHAKARKMLESGRYDWVVLQDQSQTPAFKPEETMNSVKRWAALAKKHDTKVMLFLTWAHATQEGGKVKPLADMQDKTSTTYCRAAVENKVRVAPVGEAWARWYRRMPDKILHDRDGSHPNAMGTYLAACVLHRSISGETLKGVPGVLRFGRQVVLRVPGNVASAMQKTANATVKGFTPKGWLEKKAEKDASRPSEEEVKASLKKGMKIDELVDMLGKPILSSRQRGQVTHQFSLRGGVEFCAYCSSKGEVRQVTFAAPGRMVDIVDLSQL